MDDLKMVDTKELARLLNKSTSTIKRWKQNGTLPRPATGFDKDYWSLGQIKKWMVQNGLFGTSQPDSN